MSKKPDPDFYRRMKEAKARKKQALEQKQLHDQFGDVPLPPQVVIKSEFEQRLDQAFNELKQKLQGERPPTQQERIQQAFDDLARKAQGI